MGRQDGFGYLYVMDNTADIDSLRVAHASENV
jgi:hypothetical protein